MYFLIFLAVVICIYVTSFKDCFKTENFEKVKPVISLVAVVVILFAVLNCILGRI